MANERNVLLLDANGKVLNVIVINDDTPNDFLQFLVSDTGVYSDVVETVKLTKDAPVQPGLGWTRSSAGKFEPPATEEPIPEPDVVAEVVEDDRLSNLNESQKAVLEDVLTEKIGRPTPRPEPEPTP